MNTPLDTKPHYELLDALRGVAALMVVCYHVCEGFAFAGGFPVIEGINHGYLAVDFFFLLSGFVVSYAYDSRWATTLTLPAFFKRRLIRLHPMVVMGTLCGLAAFCLQGGTQWDGTQSSPWAVTLSVCCALLLLPVWPGSAAEVRGNGEMFPLNGPAWSLFFEYVGNLLYALLIRRLSLRVLKLWVLLCGLGYGLFASLDAAGYGHMGVGWTLQGINLPGGLLRMLFPFSFGMLLARTFRPRPLRGAFWIAALLLVALLLVPCIPGQLGILSLNGLYETACVCVAFPLVLHIAASGQASDAGTSRLSRFLGDISYPLYLTHYPFMYLFYAWLIDTRQHSFGQTWPVALCLVAGCIGWSWLCMRFYEKPLLRILRNRWTDSKQKQS